MLGLYDLQLVHESRWFGIPDARWPGLELSPSVEFWALLPTFVVLTPVLGTKSISDSMIVQQASRREPRAIHFRDVQGTVNANGMGMLLAGIVGTPPTQPLSSFSSSLVNLTGVASRRVGFAIAGIFALIAIFPKLGAVLLTVPSPVMGAYLLMILGIFFVGGMQTATSGGLDQQKVLVIGISFGAGLGLNNHEIITYVWGDALGPVFGSGVMYGAIVAILLTLFLEYTGPRPRRLQGELDTAELPAIDEFLSELASDLAWDEGSTARLRSAGEETLLSLTQADAEEVRDRAPRLRVTARPDGESIELEFVSSIDDENLEDQLAYLTDEIRLPDANEISLRLLRHQASSVRHQKYHGIDIVTVLVEGSR